MPVVRVEIRKKLAHGIVGAKCSIAVEMLRNLSIFMFSKKYQCE